MSESDERALNEIPTGRWRRAGSLGALGARLSTTMARAGAQSRFGTEEARDEVWDEAHRAVAGELVRTLGSMRGLAAKFGQLVAHAPGGLPKPYEALFQLTHQVPPMGYSMIKSQCMADLGASPTKLFAEFDKRPFAAASLGQVHRARHHDGRELAVKVQYPAVDRSVRADLDNIHLLVGPISKIVRVDNAQEAFHEVAAHLIDELDYVKEAQNATTFARAFAGDEHIRIPSVIPELSSSRVLTMEHGHGEHLDAYLSRGTDPSARSKLGETLLRFVWTSILQHGILHADPNPGNFLFGDDFITVLDFGCVKRLPEEFVTQLRRMLLAAMEGRREALEEVALDIGLLGPNAGEEFRRQAIDLCETWTRPLTVDEFDWTDPSYLERLGQAQKVVQQIVRGGEDLHLPKHWLFYGRQMVGGTYVLHKLGTRARMRLLVGALLEA